MWPSETNGVISCSGTSAFRLLLSGYKNKTEKVTSLSYNYLGNLQKQKIFLSLHKLFMAKSTYFNNMIKLTSTTLAIKLIYLLKFNEIEKIVDDKQQKFKPT
jgi:hypothetical protein